MTPDHYSGVIFDRPAFKEMMQDITDGKINCVIVKAVFDTLLCNFFNSGEKIFYVHQ